MSDFDVVIAHRGNDPSGLWFTVQSIDIEMAKSGFSYQYFIVVNGQEKLGAEITVLQRVLDHPHVAKIGWMHLSKDPLAPPVARQMAIDKGSAPLIALFDSHVLVTDGFFKRAKFDHMQYDIDILHSATKFFHGDCTNYHYTFTLENNFWGHAHDVLDNEFKAYQIGAGGHGGIVVKRSSWEEVGGYWDGFVGYGGEEMYMDLKMALLDKKVWLDPQLIHYHYAGDRGYNRHYTEDYFVNMMAVAHIIGGEKYLDKVMKSFGDPRQFTIRFTEGVTLYDLYQRAYTVSKDRKEWLDGKRKRTLDEQLAKFKELGVPH